MRNFSLIICCTLIVFSVHAQRRNEGQSQVENQQIQEREFQRIKEIRDGLYTKPEGMKPVFQNISQLYRKPTDRELKLLTPEQEDMQKFAGLLQQPNTGIIKLV